MELSLRKTQLLCAINYPGFVKNFDRFEEAVGIEKLRSTLSNPQLRITLQLDSKNNFAKPILGTQKSIDNQLLLKVRLKRKKGAPAKSSQIINCEIVGVPTTAFDFNNMADFQYLPVEQNSSGKIIDMQKALVGYDPASPFHSFGEFLSQDLPIIACPSLFSRFERPVTYYFRPEFQDQFSGSQKQKKSAEGEEDDSVADKDLVANSTRKRRLNGTQYMRFGDPTVPFQICPAIVSQKVFGRLKDISSRLEKLFAKCPCWFTKALNYEFNDNLAYQKILLKGAVQRHAYLCYTGPWSRQWIRFGYDPRRDRNSKLLQTMDYRLPKKFTKTRQLDTNGSHIKIKRVFMQIPDGEVTSTSEEVNEARRKQTEKVEFEIFPDQLPTCYNTFSQVR